MVGSALTAPEIEDTCNRGTVYIKLPKMDFIIDTKGDFDNEEKNEKTTSKNNSIISQLLEEYKETLLAPNSSAVNQKVTPKPKDNYCKRPKRTTPEDIVKQFTARRDDLDKVLSKSVITPDFEKLQSVPPYEVSKRRLRAERRKQRELTKGSKWFGLPATEVTEEVKRDLEILQMRSVLDPKHFYKKNDLKVLPKYFQIGKVVDSPLDYYSDRLTKKERKKTLVDELLADAEFKKYNKRKYQEIMEEKQKTHYKAWRQAKRMKKRK